MSKQILLVDDDPLVLSTTARYLEGRGFKVVCADNGERAIELAVQRHPDLVITDAEMKGVDGFALCTRVKEAEALSKVPVIILSGKKITEGDILAGYDKGADDYILKPVSFPVLSAKIGVVLRRYEISQDHVEKIIRLGMVIDPAARTVTVRDNVVNLTRKEFDLLTALLIGENRVLTTTHLLESVWGYDPASYNDPHTVSVHISSLRKKLGPEIGAHIKSILGHGYKFE